MAFTAMKDLDGALKGREMTGRATVSAGEGKRFSGWERLTGGVGA